MTTIRFKYLNHRGEIAQRTIDVDAVEFFRDPAFGYQPGWFISGHCHDRNARRSFALNRIIIGETQWVRGIFSLMRIPS